MANRSNIHGGVFAVLVLGWVSSLGCFPFLSMRTASNSQKLAGTLHSEVQPSRAQLYIVGMERTERGRRYHLALRGYLAERHPDAALRFSFDEEGGAALIVREKTATEYSGVTGQEVRILHQNELRFVQQARDEQLDNVDGLPTAVLVASEYRNDEVAVTFEYRDSERILRNGRMVLVPSSVCRHPVMARMNKLNYLWTVPVDAVVVVGGWTAFITVAIIVMPFAK